MSSATVEQVVATAEPVVAVRRFSWWGRATHAVLALSVFGLVLTGMPLRYPDAFWAQPLFLLWQTERGKPLPSTRSVPCCSSGPARCT